MRLAGEMAFERADDKQRSRAQANRQIKRRDPAHRDKRNDRNDRADDEGQPHHQGRLERLIDFRAAQTEHFFLKGAHEDVALGQQHLHHAVALLFAQPLFAEGFQQALRGDIRLAGGELFGIGKLFVENIFLRAGREIGTGGHGDRPGKHRGQAR